MIKIKMLCDYGCGQEAKYQFKNGKWCCENDFKLCPEKRKERSIITKNIMSNFDIRRKISIKNTNPSQKTRQKMSTSQKGKVPWNKGKTNIYSKETLKKMSENSKGQQGYWLNKKRDKKTIEKIRRNHTIINGSLNPNWRGGISCEPYCEQWSDQEYKESIKQRDGYKCLNPECNKTSDKLCIHHIDYVKKNCHPSNLITVCISCNGKANKDREWHKAWYQAIIKQRYQNN